MLDTILVTGGAGFIGAHVARAAAEAGSSVIVLDDLSGTPDFPPLPAKVSCVRGDIADRSLVAKLIEKSSVTAVVHLAGKICVGESIVDPSAYFDHNLVRLIALLDVVREIGPKAFVLSSSASVYGDAVSPITEHARYAPVNPYGATKLAAEHVLASYGRAYGIGWAALRYFNAAGAHPDGTLSERHDPETHLIPLAIDAAMGRRPPLTVFGNDYPTRDGTCERDYVHVCDLAAAHLAAITAIDRHGEVGAINLGNGRGHTVLEVIETCARVLGRGVPYTVGARREGDPAVLVADGSLARQVFGWQPARGNLGTIVEDAACSRGV